MRGPCVLSPRVPAESTLLGIFGMFEWALWKGRSVEEARTVAVNTLVILEIFYLFSVRYLRTPALTWRGRPVLVLPEAPTRAEISLDVIGVAWDFSRPAARAVADALPLLQGAKTVRVVTVTNEKTIETRRSGGELARHLACHGVDVVREEEDAGGRSIGEALEAYADACKLDVLVMGAYGHSRMRDFILGGATKSIVARPPLPVLLAH